MDSNLREVNDELMKEWFKFREETKLYNINLITISMIIFITGVRSIIGMDFAMGWS